MVLPGLSPFLAVYCTYCIIIIIRPTDSQVIIARHENCRQEMDNRIGHVTNRDEDLTAEEEKEEADLGSDPRAVEARWCRDRVPEGQLEKCLGQIAGLCGPGNSTLSCPFLAHKRPKRQIGGRVEKANKDDLAKLKGAFGQLAQQFFADLLKGGAGAKTKGGFMGDVPLNDGPTSQRAVAGNELQQNDPDGYFHGDMDMSKTQVNYFMNLVQLGATALFSGAVNKLASGNGGGRHALARQKRKISKEPAYHLWNVNPIPYQFNRNVPAETRQIIEQAINLWQTNTCRRWAKDIAGLDRVEFINGDGCSSYVGKTGGTQDISIRTPGCDVVGIASHEIGHSLGFFHEQGRPDQTNNVIVNFGNIMPNRKDNFYPMPVKDVNTYNMPYEYGSVMHYDGMTRGFTYNPNKYSISTKDPKFQNTIGQRVGPSFIDYKLVNLAYCQDACSAAGRLGCAHGGYEDPNDCSRCKCPGGFGGRLCETAAASSPGCGGVVRAGKQEQYIASPNYPSQYPKGKECNWYILAPVGGRVFLTFEQPFSLPCDEVCTQSFVEVKRFQDFQRTGYRFCCNTAPEPLVSESNELVVIFKSNGQLGNGFRARVSTDSSGPVNIVVPTAPPPLVATAAPIGGGGFFGGGSGGGGSRGGGVSGGGAVTPKNAQGCDCGEWGPWSQCTQPCGGCGFVSRQRRCNRSNCYSQEKKHCNFNQCPPNTNVLMNNGQIDLVFSGCCVGTFPSNGVCGGLNEAVSQFFTGLVQQGGQG